MSKIFPKSVNKLPVRIVTILFIVVVTGLVAFYYYAVPRYTRVGFAPDQPVPYDHALHAGQLGIDCRYCHSFVESSGKANIPDATTCMNCHNQIQTQSPLLEMVRASAETGEPIPWVRVHQLPDYVYFNHSVHVNRGISCYDCHGQVNEMAVVQHAQPLSMAFCLECHRNPERYVRPPEEVFNLDWRPESPEEQLSRGLQTVHDWHIDPPLNCSSCHQ
ncbi:MAG TPA: ammonia-forming cytochrome c nitrite reductase subunit c552 [Opitutales bacterium]|nr:ammonia-forming cytochrome c nitrite reductase subunit c552 [Opitutales bacterium]